MRFVPAVTLAMLLVSPMLFAKDFQYTACTVDHITTTLDVTLNDDALAKQPELAQVVQDAFTKTASLLTTEELVSAPGYQTFLSYLSDAAKQAIDGISGPPTLHGVKC